MTSAFSSFGTRRQARSMISSSPSSEARCGKIVRIRTALAVEVSHQNFVMSIRPKIGCADRVDAGATAALHVRSVFQNCDLVILGIDRDVQSDLLEQRPCP